MLLRRRRLLVPRCVRFVSRQGRLGVPWWSGQPQTIAFGSQLPLANYNDDSAPVHRWAVLRSGLTADHTFKVQRASGVPYPLFDVLARMDQCYCARIFPKEKKNTTNAIPAASRCRPGPKQTHCSSRHHFYQGNTIRLLTSTYFASFASPYLVRPLLLTHSSHQHASPAVRSVSCTGAESLAPDFPVHNDDNDPKLALQD